MSLMKSRFAGCTHTATLPLLRILMALLFRSALIIGGQVLTHMTVPDGILSFLVPAIGIILTVLGAIALIGFLAATIAFLLSGHPLRCAVSLAARHTSPIYIFLALLSVVS